VKRWVLLNPGPVNVTERVRRSLMGPDLCHREKEFSDLLSGIRRKLLRAFGVARSHEVAVLTGSGTLAVEAMLCSFTGKVLVLSSGVYGERLREILKAHGMDHLFLAAPLGGFPELSEIERLLRRDRSLAAVALVHHETSTGALAPLKEVAGLAKKYGKAVLVDAVSSLGAEPIPFQNIDLLAASAGKCLHGFPGISFVFVAKKGRRLLSERPRSHYMDLRTILSSENGGSVPFTPAVQLCYALDEALNQLLREGVARRIRSYAAKNALLEKGLKKLGLEFLVPEGRRSHVLAALWLPSGLSYEALHASLKKKGFIIYAGQSNLKERIFRVSNLGAVRGSDLERFLRELGRTLARHRARRPKAIVLAAGRGRRFGARTKTWPKCLIPLGSPDRTLLGRYFSSFRRSGVRDVVLVVGHLEPKIRAFCRRHAHGLRVRFVRNPRFKRGSILSLARAGSELRDNVLIMDADVFYPHEALERLLGSDKKSAFLVDTRARGRGEEMMVQRRGGRLWSIRKKLDPSLAPVGEATGILKLSGQDAALLRRILERMTKGGVRDAEYEDSYCELMKRRRLGWVDTGGAFWSEMDSEHDLKKILSGERA
jgi:2-aminoethylphosphonate-pyruvate transaminase